MYRFPLGVQEVGKCDHRDEFGVTNTAQEITLSEGKNSIEITPSPSEENEVYFGGVGVTAAKGTPISGGKIWNNCKPGFSIYLVTSTTANVRIAEYV